VSVLLVLVSLLLVLLLLVVEAASAALPHAAATGTTAERIRAATVLRSFMVAHLSFGESVESNAAVWVSTHPGWTL